MHVVFSFAIYNQIFHMYTNEMVGTESSRTLWLVSIWLEVSSEASAVWCPYPIELFSIHCLYYTNSCTLVDWNILLELFACRQHDANPYTLIELHILCTVTSEWGTNQITEFHFSVFKFSTLHYHNKQY